MVPSTYMMAGVTYPARMKVAYKVAREARPNPPAELILHWRFCRPRKVTEKTIKKVTP